MVLIHLYSQKCRVSDLVKRKKEKKYIVLKVYQNIGCLTTFLTYLLCLGRNVISNIKIAECVQYLGP